MFDVSANRPLTDCDSKSAPFTNFLMRIYSTSWRIALALPLSIYNNSWIDEGFAFSCAEWTFISRRSHVYTDTHIQIARFGATTWTQPIFCWWWNGFNFIMAKEGSFCVTIHESTCIFCCMPCYFATGTKLFFLWWRHESTHWLNSLQITIFLVINMCSAR